MARIKELSGTLVSHSWSAGSCLAGDTTSKQKSQQPKTVKAEIIEEFLLQLCSFLRENGGDSTPGASMAEGVRAHFDLLPTRYSLDVNIDSVEDVLNHKACSNIPMFPIFDFWKLNQIFHSH